MVQNPEIAELSRRERKLAQTRLGLLQALLERLEARPLEAIGVKELCDAVDISEASFFNHFPSKRDLLVYHVQLWSVEAAWHARQAARQGPRAAIQAVFRFTGQEASRHPRVMAEVIAFQARLFEPPRPRPLTRAERLLAFPALEGGEAVEALGMEEVLLPYIGEAIARGELPQKLEPRTALLALASVFFGVPLILGPRAPRAIEAAYLQQLELVWRGLRGLAGRKRAQRRRR